MAMDATISAELGEWAAMRFELTTFTLAKQAASFAAVGRSKTYDRAYRPGAGIGGVLAETTPGSRFTIPFPYKFHPNVLLGGIPSILWLSR